MDKKDDIPILLAYFQGIFQKYVNCLSIDEWKLKLANYK